MLKPVSSHRLARKIAPNGKSIKKTSSSAAPIHRGKVGSLNRSTDQPLWPTRPSVEVCEAGMILISARGRARARDRARFMYTSHEHDHEKHELCPKELHEAFFYLGIASFQLVGVGRQKFQILQLGLVRRIGDLGMAGIKTFLIG